MEHLNKKRIEALIIPADFKKAFDSINTQFIDTAIAIGMFGFGPSFRIWVKVFFSNRKTYLLLHGFLGDAINLEQGVPQGDILSRYFVNICVEILGLKVCYTSKIG